MTKSDLQSQLHTRRQKLIETIAFSDDEISRIDKGLDHAYDGLDPDEIMEV